MAETSVEQRHWLVGLSRRLPRGDAPCRSRRRQASARAKIPLTILFATESGNAEGVAADAKKVAGQAGLRRAGCSTWRTSTPAEIAAARHLLVIASTWGEGDPPERAAEFYGR